MIILTYHKGFTIPVYDIGTLVAGFYIGYCDGKGIETSQTLEYMTKYCPTILAVCMSPLMRKTTYHFNRWISKKMKQNLDNGNLEVRIGNDYIKKYKDMNNEEKKKFRPQIEKNIQSLESKIRKPEYLRPTLLSGARTAIETVIGYYAGRIYSQIN